MNGRLSKSIAYEMGVQISRCVHSQVSFESPIWADSWNLVECLRNWPGSLQPDHVHMLISIPPKYAISQVIEYIKGKSAIHIARCYVGKKRNFVGERFWARGYFVSNVG